MMNGGMMDGGMMTAMGIWALLVLAVLVAVLVAAVLASVWLVRRLRADRAAATVRDTDAEQTLRRRHAAGEIDDDEYERRRAMLQSGSPRR